MAWLLILVVVLVVLIAVPVVVVADVMRRARLGVLETCRPEDVPTSFGGAVAEFVQQHFVVAGAIRITNPKAPDAFVVLFASPDLGAFGRLWVTGEGRAQAVVSSPLQPGMLVTASQWPTSILSDELQQMFPDASIAELCVHHGEALAFLAGRGVEPGPVVVDQAEAGFRESWIRDLAASRKVSPGVIVEAATRLLFHRPRYVGPLAEQEGIDERLPRRSDA